MKIIGISGLAGSGKDLAGNYIISKIRPHASIELLRMAEPLKEACGLWFGWNVERLTHDRDYKESNLNDDGSVDPICEMLGMTRREVMQKLGTECMREGMHSDFWIILLKNNINNGTYNSQYGIIPDCRFTNELKMCDYTIRINGETTVSGPVHLSEQEWGTWDNWSIVIDNTIDRSISMEENREILFKKLDTVIYQIMEKESIYA